jgi:LPXTG-motif cell wall-anchored protein
MTDADVKKALLAIAAELKRQEHAEIRLGIIGLIGLGLIGTAGYFLWRKR